MSTETSDNVSEAELGKSEFKGSDLRYVLEATHFPPLRCSFSPGKIIHGMTFNNRFQRLYEWS